MSKTCPECQSLPSVLNELQKGCIQFDVSEGGFVSEKGEIQVQDPSGVVNAICKKCKHEWRVTGISHAADYSNL